MTDYTPKTKMIKHLGTRVDISALSRNDLVSMKLTIEQEIDAIRNQIEQAKLEYQATGVPVDKAWLFSANRARANRGRDVQWIMLEIAKKREEEKALNIEASRQEHDEFLKNFFQVAKIHLNTDTFKMLVNETRLAVTANGTAV